MEIKMFLNSVKSHLGYYGLGVLHVGHRSCYNHRCDLQISSHCKFKGTREGHIVSLCTQIYIYQNSAITIGSLFAANGQNFANQEFWVFGLADTSGYCVDQIQFNSTRLT